MNEEKRDVKANFDEFWDCVGDVVFSLVQSDYTSTDVFLSNFAFVKERYFSYNATLTPEDRIWLAENYLSDFVELLQCSTAIAAISATLEVITKPAPHSQIH
ncbi:hypothetical protein [Winslowiella iniecta]|uniref:Uncharacterized protein n=1 Tax=Winslowiella iniecta TaxID=1560201 RepID=A0A0L7SX69_9GAMM|nr:hypothetical protein [Winslowiella iniecta]KOC87531.1 hypothetical protein NG42_20230 [Winslowiella iniecta]KOC88108.1 hypothetical protein NG43_20805 [Winslowiella iniecta]